MSLKSLCAVAALLASAASTQAQGYMPTIVLPPRAFLPPPPPPMPRAVLLAPGHVVAILRDRHGFAEIGRPERDGPVYHVEAIDRRGVLVAVVIDAFDGEVLSRDRIGRAMPGPQVVAPQPGAGMPAQGKPGAKVVTVPPRPPERPAGLVARAPEPAAPRAPAVSAIPKVMPAYPPPVDPRLSEKLGAK